MSIMLVTSITKKYRFTLSKFKLMELQEITLVTHEGPHTDEFAGELVLTDLGHLIGIRATQLVFVGKSIFKRPENTFCLGVGGGQFDEHVYDGHWKKKQGIKTSSVMLVAEKLGILGKDEYAAYEHVVKYAHDNDVNGPRYKMELGKILKDKFAQGQSEEDVWKWVRDVFEKRMSAFLEGDRYKHFSDSINNLCYTKDQVEKELSYFTPQKQKVRRFVLSKRFTFNDIVAVKLAMFFGQKMFGTDTKTFVCFVDSRHYRPKSDDLCIGFGDGQFGTLPAKKMAKAVNLDRQGFRGKKFHHVMDYVDQLNDENNCYSWELAGLLTDQLFAIESGGKHWDIYRWVSDEIRVMLEKQKDFLNAKHEFHSNLNSKDSDKVDIIHCYGYVHKKIAVINGINNPQITNIALSKHGYSCDVVVYKNDRGNVIILTLDPKKKGSRFKLDVVTAELRYRELLLKGFMDDEIDSRLLYQSGTLINCEEWFWQDVTQSLINGGRTHSDIPATKISLDEIVAVVTTVMNIYLGKCDESEILLHKHRKEPKQVPQTI